MSSRIGYDVTGEWLKAIRRYEGVLDGEMKPLQNQLDQLTEHSKNLSKLLEVVYREKDKKPADKKNKQKIIDFRPYPEYMNLVDKVRIGSMQSFHEALGSTSSDHEERIPVIPEHTYSWENEEIDALIASLNEDAKRTGTDITPIMQRMSHSMDKSTRVVEAGSRGKDRGVKEMEHIISNSNLR
jgi:hypothetical protein